MRGMREHIEQLDAFNAVARQRRDIFCHRLRVAAGVDDVVRCHLAQIVAQHFPDAPARRFTSTSSGTLSCPVANCVESSAWKCSRVNPSSAADCLAQAIASAEISIPVSCMSGVAQCRPKPPTPQNRSHHMMDIYARTQSRAVAIKRTRDGRVGLEEALRTDPQRYIVERFCQRMLFGEEDLPLPFHDSHMHRLNIRGDNG